MKEREKIIQYLLNKQNPYMLEVEDMLITIEYSKTNKKFSECMLNILKKRKDI